MCTCCCPHTAPLPVAMSVRVRLLGAEHGGAFTVIPGPVLHTAAVQQGDGSYRTEVLQPNGYYEVTDGDLAGTAYLVMR